MEHIARIAKIRNAFSIFTGKCEGKKQLGVGEMIILKWILGK
jgi:hypothetical protein